MTRKNTPEVINLPAGQLDEIKTRLAASPILEEDKKIILLILTSYGWLYRQLQSKKIGIQRLKSLFGFSTEKLTNLKKKTDNETTPPDLNASPDAAPSSTLVGGNVNPIKKHPSGTRKKIMGA
jgi:hypothetical protein